MSSITSITFLLSLLRCAVSYRLSFRRKGPVALSLDLYTCYARELKKGAKQVNPFFGIVKWRNYHRLEEEINLRDRWEKFFSPDKLGGLLVREPWLN